MNELSILDTLFNEVLGNSANVYCGTGISPRVDVSEDDKSYLLEMELPGRTEEDINIEIDQDKLSISSKKIEEDKKEKENKNEKSQKYLLRERKNGNFERNFTLPKDVDADSISARFKNGILSINMQKKNIAAPKKIAIEAC